MPGRSKLFLLLVNEQMLTNALSVPLRSPLWMTEPPLHSQAQQVYASTNSYFNLCFTLYMEGIQKSTHAHGTNVMMMTHDKLSYLIISHPENGRKRNSIAASIQKRCLDNQCCSQWFPSRNTHNFATAADSNSTWLLCHAKTSKTTSPGPVTLHCLFP